MNKKDVSSICGIDFSKNRYYQRMTKSKGWEILLYPDSIYFNPNFENVLEEWRFPCCYVLHNKDYYDKDVFYDDGDLKGELKYAKGELKKPHYHIYFWADSAMRFTTALDLFEDVGGSRIKPINNKSGSIRYTTHIDYPNKAQYDVNEVVVLCGLDFDKFYYSDAPNIDFAIERMIDFCNLNHIYSTNVFQDFAKRYNREWWAIFSGNHKCRSMIEKYCRDYGYEYRLFMDETDSLLHKPKKRIESFRMPLYDESGKLQYDERGEILADKQILYH